jgi:hypothetical protein
LLLEDGWKEDCGREDKCDHDSRLEPVTTFHVGAPFFDSTTRNSLPPTQ